MSTLSPGNAEVVGADPVPAKTDWLKITTVGLDTAGNLANSIWGKSPAPANSSSGTPTWLLPVALGGGGLLVVFMIMNKKKK